MSERFSISFSCFRLMPYFISEYFDEQEAKVVVNIPNNKDMMVSTSNVF